MEGDVEGDVEVYYTDIVGMRRRRRKSTRKVSRGPYSGAEKLMNRAYLRLKADTHYMDGELSDLAARYITAWMTSVSRVMREEFAYSVLPDPQPDDWEHLKDKMGLVVISEQEGFDVGDLT